MKQIINDYYLEPYPKEFLMHFRNDFGLNEEYQRIFDSITTKKGDSVFHQEETMIPAERFEKMTRKMVRIHVDEMIRLALIGYKNEQKKN